MWTDHNRHAMPCRFNNVVPAAPHQTSSDESDIGQGIHCRKFPDCVQQQNPSSERFVIPQSSLHESKIFPPKKVPNPAESFRMPRRKNHHCSRMGPEHILESAN